MLATIDTEKLCRVCGEYYPLSSFTERHKGRGDYVTICNACKSAAQVLRDAERRQSMVINGDYSKAYSPADPWHDIACAVLAYAVEDWRRVCRCGRYKMQGQALGAYDNPRAELLDFFASPWFETLCDLAGYEPEIIRIRIGIR